MKKTATIMILFIFTLTLFVGCKEQSTFAKNKDEVVFSLDNSNTVAYMRGKTDDDGNLVYLKIDEIFTPVEWAVVSQQDATAFNLETVNYETTDYSGNASTIVYAKYIYINEVLYTTNISDADGVIFKDANDSLFNIRTYATAKQYYETANKFMAEKGNIFAFGGGENGETVVPIKIAYQAGVTMGGDALNAVSVSVFKRESGYWGSRSGSKLGFVLNLENIEEFLMRNDLDIDLKKAVATDSGEWAVDGVSTGATITSADIYLNLAGPLSEKLKLEN